MGYEEFERLCREKGVSAYRVAKDTGVSTSTLSSWKKGKYIPKSDKLSKIADYFEVDVERFQSVKKKYTMKLDRSLFMNALSKAMEADSEFNAMLDSIDQMYQIPVVRRVAAGVPIDSQEELIGYEEISESMANDGTYFGLRIQGDSMEPTINNGDIIIVRQQDDAEDGDIIVALINGNDGCCKRLKKYEDGSIALMSDNASYKPMFFNGSEIDATPIRICGIVKELRRKF